MASIGFADVLASRPAASCRRTPQALGALLAARPTARHAPVRPLTSPSSANTSHIGNRRVHAGAQKQGRERGAVARRPAPTPRSPPSNDDPEPGRLALFRWALYARRWDVPWGGKELALGMVGWAASFALVGAVALPLTLRAVGVPNLGALSANDKSAVLLLNQVAETVVGIGVVRCTLRDYDLPPDVLRSDPARPLARPDGWLLWALLGVLCAPVAIGTAAAACAAAGYTGGGRGTAEGVAGLLELDPATFASLFVVTAVLAPVLEETVFRGFLLPTLTKWLPTPAAVLLSALAFGAAHLSPRDFPQLVAFGVLLGFAYVRSRNLLTPMLMHGAWNGTVLAVLYVLSQQGVDLQRLIEGS